MYSTFPLLFDFNTTLTLYIYSTQAQDDKRNGIISNYQISWCYSVQCKHIYICVCALNTPALKGLRLKAIVWRFACKETSHSVPINVKRTMFKPSSHPELFDQLQLAHDLPEQINPHLCHEMPVQSLWDGLPLSICVWDFFCVCVCHI